MWHLVSRLALVAGLLFAARTAPAAVTITTSSSRISVVQNTEDPPGSGAYTIVLQDNSNEFNTNDTWTITPTLTTDRINSVVVRAPHADRTLYVQIGSDAAWLAAVGSVRYDSSPSNRQGYVWIGRLRCTGDLGAVEVAGISDTVVEGDVTGDFSMVPVYFSPPRIGSVHVQGNFDGDVILPNAWPSLVDNLGRISNLTVDGRLGIGPASPAEVVVGGELRIKVGGVASVNIRPPGPADEWPILRRFECQEFNGVARVGVFQPVATQSFFKADIMLGTLLVSRAFVECPGCLRYISAGTDQFKGRVIFNATNDPDETQWTAPVYVGDPAAGGLTLYDLYPQTAAQLGGGSAGVLPFSVHQTDSNPVHNTTIPSAGPASGAPFVRWYGPVTWSVEAPPLLVSHRKIGALASDPTHDLTDCFALKPGDDETKVNFELTNGFLPVGDYVVTPVSGVLKNGVLGVETGDVRTGSAGELRFLVRDPCPGDLNHDGNVGTPDLVIFLGQFGQSGPCGNIADLDGDLAVSTPDLPIIIGNFGPCNALTANAVPTPLRLLGTLTPSATAHAASTTQQTQHAPDEGGAPSSTQAGAVPVPPVLAALGFTSTQQYTEFLASLTPSQLEAHLLEVLDTASRLGF